MAEPYLGQIIIFAGTYAPRGWAFCNGQSLSISQNPALYSLLGTTYGGDGTSSFNLPNLQSRVPVGTGQGAGLSNYQLGSAGGSESVTLNTQQIPAHNHMVNVDASVGAQTAPNGNNLAEPSAGGRPPTPAASYTSGTPGSPAQLSANTVASQGGGQGHENRQPYLAMNYIIALQGIFPPRP